LKYVVVFRGASVHRGATYGHCLPTIRACWVLLHNRISLSTHLSSQAGLVQRVTLDQVLERFVVARTIPVVTAFLLAVIPGDPIERPDRDRWIDAFDSGVTAASFRHLATGLDHWLGGVAPSSQRRHCLARFTRLLGSLDVSPQRSQFGLSRLQELTNKLATLRTF
jgi:hypothetical protein